MEVSKEGREKGDIYNSVNNNKNVNMHISGKKQHLIISDTIFAYVTVSFFSPSLGISKGNGRPFLELKLCVTLSAM